MLKQKISVRDKNEALRYLVGVHVHEAEALGPWRFALNQTNISFIQICKRVQGLQDRLNGGGGLHIFYYHSCIKTHYVNSFLFLNRHVVVGLHTFAVSEDGDRLL